VRRCGPASGCAGFRRSTPHSDRGGSAVSRPRLGEAHTVGSVHDGSVSLDALVLALASVARLSTVAAVYAMLSAARPIRLLTAYILAGFVVSTGVGIVLVNLLNDSIRRRTPDEVPAVIAFILAAVSLGYAAGLLSGRVPAPVREPMRTHLGLDSHSWLGRQLTAMSVPRAALAGILTHPPGIFYLAALSAITVSYVEQREPGLPSGRLQRDLVCLADRGLGTCHSATGRAAGLSGKGERVALAPPTEDHDRGVRSARTVSDLQGRRGAPALMVGVPDRVRVRRACRPRALAYETPRAVPPGRCSATRKEGSVATTVEPRRSNRHRVKQQTAASTCATIRSRATTWPIVRGAVSAFVGDVIAGHRDPIHRPGCGIRRLQDANGGTWSRPCKTLWRISCRGRQIPRCVKVRRPRG
jgi:hypothetical protein